MSNKWHLSPNSWPHSHVTGGSQMFHSCEGEEQRWAAVCVGDLSEFNQLKEILLNLLHYQ